jgi:membrane associated rhomboid family serine protease
VHDSNSHVLINVAFELLVGLPLEMSQGTWRVALVYLTGVAAGSLGSSCFEPSVNLAGASGGVYALISAHLATLILNWEEDTLILRRRIRSAKIKRVHTWVRVSDQIRDTYFQENSISIHTLAASNI